MALSLESAGRVRQKVHAENLNPGLFYAMKAFFLDWAANHGNADLQFVPYAGTDAEGANGYNSGIAAACTLRVFYGKKTRTAEDVFMSVLDDASGAEGTTFLASIGFFGANGTSTTLPQDEQLLLLGQNGIPVAAGVNIKAYTTVAGVTDTTAGAAPNGWFIVSA